MKIRSLRARTCAAVASLAAGSAQAQVVLPNHVIISYNTDTLDQFGVDQWIHNGKALLNAPAFYTSQAPKVYLVDLSDGSLIHEFDQLADDVVMNDTCIAFAVIDDGESKVVIHDPDTYEPIHTITFGSYFQMSSGLDLALQGSNLVVGASWIDTGDNGHNNGIARVYDTITGDMIHDLTPDDLPNSSGFGSRVLIDAGRILVAQSRATSDPESGPSISVFDTNSGDFIRVIESLGGDDVPQSITSFDLEGDQLLYGLWIPAQFVYRSDAYILDLDQPESQPQRITPPETSYELRFYGFDARFYGSNIVLSGAAFEPGDFFGRARAFVYDRPSLTHTSTLKGTPNPFRETFILPNQLDDSFLHISAVELGAEGPVGDGRLLSFDLDRCPADIDGTQAIDFRDISALLSNRFDWNDDLVFDFFDIQGYLKVYTQGCTE